MMFGRSEKIWKQYPQNIAAVNNREALYLLHYMAYVEITKGHLCVTEILDLQRYRITSNKKKVSKILALPEKNRVFLFPINKN
jgi:hypothetical protein